MSKKNDVKQDYFEKMADIALIDNLTITPEQLRRQVISVLREVELDARYKAVSLVYEVADKINKMPIF